MIHFLDGVFENIVDWVLSNLHLDLTNCTVDSHMSIPEDVIQVVNAMGKQEVTPDGIQFRNIHHKLILSDLCADDDLYNDDRYASDADWKIGKEPEKNLKKIGFDIDIDVDEDEIDDLIQRRSSPQ